MSELQALDILLGGSSGRVAVHTNDPPVLVPPVVDIHASELTVEGDWVAQPLLFLTPQMAVRCASRHMWLPYQQGSTPLFI